MKILLTLYLCSTVAGTCLEGFEWPERYDDMYDCIQAGYQESQKKMTEIGRLDVNQHQIYIRFTCTPAATT